MNNISAKAEIDPRARIGNGCTIFPFVYIEGDVVIGDNCVIFPFVSILNGCRIGNNNKIHQGAVIGALPQDFNFRGEKSECILGNNNIIRENVVINRATHSGCSTVLGNNNVLMEGAHISHDTKVGNDCVFGYGTKVAGDCMIEDRVIFSSSVIENACTRVGKGSFIQAGTTFSKDVPPYIVVSPDATYGGVNSVIGQQLGVDQEALKNIANAYRLIYNGQNSLFDAIIQVREQVPDSEAIRHIADFVEASSKGLTGKL